MMTPLVFMATVWLLPGQVQGQTQDQVEALYNTLLKGQNKNIRPAVNHSDPTEIDVTFSLFQILDIDEVTGKLSLSGELEVEWYDHRMSWNPMEYGGLETINVPSPATWKPDLVLMESFDNDIAFGYKQHWVNVRYLYDGKAVFAPAGVISSACDMNLREYPYDTQICEMRLYPRGITKQEMILNTNTTELSIPIVSDYAEWELLRNETSTGVMFDNVSYYRVSLFLKRKPEFIVVNVMFPTVWLLILNVLVFLIPVASGERVSFAVTVLLAWVFYMTIVSDYLPQSSDPVPLICYFFLSSLFLSSSILIMTICNLFIYHTPDTNTFFKMCLKGRSNKEVSACFDTLLFLIFAAWGWGNFWIFKF